MSIAGGVHMAIERACSINCTAMQIFVKNNMQWFARPLSTDEIRAFLDHQQRAELGLGFCARELFDQSRRHQSAISREFVARFSRGTDSGRSPRVAISRSASRRTPRRRRRSRPGKDHRIDRRDLAGDSKSENEDRARNHGWPGFVPRSSLRAHRAHHCQCARAGTALRLPRYCSHFCCRLRHRL